MLLEEASKLNKVEDISNQIEWVEGDVLDIPSLEEAMKDTLRSSDSGYGLVQSIQIVCHEINIKGTANLVNVV